MYLPTVQRVTPRPSLRHLRNSRPTAYHNHPPSISQLCMYMCIHLSTFPRLTYVQTILETRPLRRPAPDDQPRMYRKIYTLFVD